MRRGARPSVPTWSDGSDNVVSSVGLELGRDLPSGSVFSLTSLAGVGVKTSGGSEEGLGEDFGLALRFGLLPHAFHTAAVEAAPPKVAFFLLGVPCLGEWCELRLMKKKAWAETNMFF